MKRLLFAVAALLAAAAIAAAVVRGGSATPSSRATLPSNGLFAYVVATNRGPLTACPADASQCTTANTVWHYVHVVNANPLTNPIATPGGRTGVPNAFLVSSVDETVVVDGTVFSVDTVTPPPNVPSGRLGTSGRWPSTVTCGQPPALPCTTVTSPAILPEENTAIFYVGWIHASNEPNGTYVFRFTIHGTLNGASVDLTASSPPIKMTS